MQSSTGSSGSSMIILVLVFLLCAAGVAAVYFWNENRKNGGLSSTPSVTTQRVTTGAGTTNSITGSSNSPKPTKTSDRGGDDDEEDSPSPTKSDSPEATPSDSPPSDSNPSSSIVSQELLDVLLKTHNDFRKVHQVDPLEWNETLAEASEVWVKNCVWEHSGGKLLEGGYGENLFGSSSTSYTETSPPVDGKAGVDAWNSEISMYTYDPPTGFTHETGHVTQTLWKGTKSVGCQFRNCKGLFESDQWGAYLVCQYYPPGNYEGAYLENVLPPLE